MFGKHYQIVKLENIENLDGVMLKEDRPHLSGKFLAGRLNGYYVYLPLRSRCNHDYSFKITSGYIDVSKMIVANEEGRYIKEASSIDSEAHKNIMTEGKAIEKLVEKTIDDYCKAVDIEQGVDYGLDRRQKRKLKNLRAYSTLRNYHSELDID